MGVKFTYLYRAFRYRLQVDPAEIRFVSESLKPGEVAVDVGCHKGAYTYWMHRSVGPGGAVYVFEPQPNQVAYLRKAFSAMHYDNVEIVPQAVSNQRTLRRLHVPEGLGKSHMASLEDIGRTHSARASYAVETTTLDEFFKDRFPGPSFIKIDVEGHELAVLEGGAGILKTLRPTLLVECEARHRPDANVRPVFQLLASLGYRGSFFLNRKRRPLSEFDSTIHQRVDTNNPDRLPRGYVNNFAFTP